MTFTATKLIAFTTRAISWLEQLDKGLYIIDTVQNASIDLALLSQNQYRIVIIDGESIKGAIKETINEISRTQPLLSIIVLMDQINFQYKLELIETGAEDVLFLSEDSALLTRSLDLVINRNLEKRLAVQQNRDLHTVTLLSRQLHNANHPNDLIIDAIEIVSTQFNLLGMVIALENGDRVHIKAGTQSNNQRRRIYDVSVPVHPYSPIRQCINKGLIFVFKDLSTNEFMPDIPIFEKFYSAIVVPLQHVNITLGAIVVLGTSTNILTRNDIVIYEHLATHLGSAYQNVRNFHVQDINARANRHLLRTWQRLSAAYSIKEVNEAIQSLSDDVKGVKNTLVWLYKNANPYPEVSASNSRIIPIFYNLLKNNVVDHYINQFEAQMQPQILWLGRSTTTEIIDLFQAMEGQQLILIPISDSARLLGCIIVSVNSTEQLGNEYINLLEGIAHAAGQTLERNMLITIKDEQTERFEAILRSIKDGVFTVSDWQDVVFCNPQFTELTGINPSQVLNRPVESLVEKLVGKSESPQQTDQQLRNAIRQITDSPMDQEYPIVELNITEYNSKLYLEFIALQTVNMDENKSWMGFIRTSEQVSSNDSQYKFTQSVIHNLQFTSNEIYNNLVNFRERQASLSPTQQIEILNNIEDQANQADKLLANTVQALKLEASNDLFDFKQITILQLMQGVFGTRSISTNRNRIEAKNSTQKAKIYADEFYLRQAFISILESLLNLSSIDSIVHISLSSNESNIIFEFENGEVNFSENQIQQISSTIYSFGEGTKQDNLFLRLQLSHRFIQKLGGQMLFEKKYPRGTTITVVFPLMANEDVILIKETKSTGTPERKPQNIMVYDENFDVSAVNYEYLETKNYSFIHCETHQQVYDEIEMVRVDLIILTVYQKPAKILDLCKQLRNAKQVNTPILILAPQNHKNLRIQALKVGADAYAELPISDEELVAYVENIFKRSQLSVRIQEPLTIGDLHIAFAQREVFLEGKKVSLTRIEYELLCTLVLNKGRVLTHDELLSEVWGPEYRDEKQYLWVNVSRLRRKLESTSQKTNYVVTQPGVGYIFNYAP